MTVQLTGSGGLFTRLGHLFGCTSDIEALMGAPATTNVLAGASLETRVAQFVTDFAAGTSRMDSLDGIFSSVASAQKAMQSFPSALIGGNNAFAQGLLVAQVNADTPLPSLSIAPALAVLISQMKAASASVEHSVVTVGAQAAAVGVTPVGNPTVLVSTVNGNGDHLEYAFPETLTVVVTDDSNGGATLNNEPVHVLGQASATYLSYQWPAGSGSSAGLNIVDATASNSAGNLLYNSDFETVTNSNVPDNFIAGPGTVGTSILCGPSHPYTGLNALAFVGDSATLSTVMQSFNTTASSSLGSGGTPATLTERTIYGVSFYYQLSAASPAAGVLEVALVDQSGTIIDNVAGSPCSTTVTLSGIADTSWHNVLAAFETPATLPATVKLRVRLSTALSTGTTLYLDHFAMTPMKQLYTGGPFVAIFSGSTPVSAGDAWTVVVSNAYGLFQKWFERCFGMRQLGLRLPSSSSPTVADSLIA